MIVVLLTTSTPVAAVVLKSTAGALPANPVPVIVTVVPPVVGPLSGLMPVTVGAATAVYVNRSAAEVAEVPAGVTTVRSTDAACRAGLLAVIVVLLTTSTPVAAVVPKSTGGGRR